MECIRGKKRFTVARDDVLERAGQYESVTIDLGTGDGRFALAEARTHPGGLVVGLDACRENLRRASLTRQANALFVIANAEELPTELTGLANRIVVNFPWGSLLRGMLDCGSTVWDGILTVSAAGVQVTLRVNDAAFDAVGLDPAKGLDLMRQSLRSRGFEPQTARTLEAQGLLRLDSSWAKRLAFGRDPRALEVAAVRRNWLRMFDARIGAGFHGKWVV